MYCVLIGEKKIHLRVYDEIQKLFMSIYNTKISIPQISAKINGAYKYPKRIHEKSKCLYECVISKVDDNEENYKQYIDDKKKYNL
jgi:hypothetical protein